MRQMGLAMENEETSSSQGREQAGKLLDAGDGIAELLKKGREPSGDALVQVMNQGFGDNRGWSDRDRDEAVETGFVMWVLAHKPELEDPCWNTVDTLRNVEKGQWLEPKRRGKSEEQRRFQHFSTPLGVGWVMAEAAELREGDKVLEPSAGLGGLVALAMGREPRLSWHVNEVEPVRHEVLKALFPEAKHTCIDALDLGASTQVPPAGFDTVIMNPPFGGKDGKGKRIRGGDVQHIKAAAQVLKPRGRIVALTTVRALPGDPLWEREMAGTGLSMVWSAELEPQVYANRMVSVKMRMSVLERDSDYASHPVRPEPRARMESAEEAMWSILTSLGGRTDRWVEKAA